MKEDGRILEVAIIGAGQIAGGYDERRIAGDEGIYSHAGAYARHGKFKLTTVYDVDYQQAQHFREYWQVSSLVRDVKDIYARYHDVVSVCTPDAAHFSLARELLQAKCCKTIFIEKPLALSLEEIAELEDLARDNGMQIVVNFQRRNEGSHSQIQALLQERPTDVLAVNAYYIKGLDHIGSTMVDTLTYLLGYPQAVLSYNRIFNTQIQNFTYEFILFYEGFHITVKTTDSKAHEYNYHIFEIDILLTDRRLTIQDNSRQIRLCQLTDYAYSGVRVLNDSAPVYYETAYKTSMVQAVDYIYDVTEGRIVHTINTPGIAYNTKLIVDTVKESYREGQIRIEMGNTEWKK